jgi:hypothetical protein
MRILPIQGVLVHALKSTRNNLSFAWHVSWPWLALIVPLNMLFEPMLPKIVPDATDPATMASNAQAVIGLFALGVISILVFSSIAVSWHRYILNDEVPQGLARLRLDSVVLRYFGNTFLIGLLVVLTLLPVVLILSLLVAALGLSPNTASILIAVLAGLIGLPLGYRLMLKLPAIAVGNPDINLKTAMQKTTGNSLQLCISGAIIFGVALLIGFVMSQILSALGADNGGASAILAVFVQQAVSWITTIFTVTFLTSLYGFFVEGRDF